MSQNHTKFLIKNIIFPKIESNFVEVPKGGEFEFSFRVGGLISSDKEAKILFGVRVASKEMYNNTVPKASVLVEVIGDFEFENSLPVVEHASQLPLAGNLLAMLYPFVREKIYSCLSTNGIIVFLPPINTIQLIKDNEKNDQFKIQDVRSKAIPSESSSEPSSV